MRKLFVALVLSLALLFSSPASAVPPLKLERFELSAAFTPPHNEPIIQNLVARYKIEMDEAFRWGRVTLDLNLRGWGLQDWRTPEVVGHGFPDAWRGSDWGMKTVRCDFNVKLGVDIYGPIQVFMEHNKWGYLASALPPEHASEYYWMTGIRWRMK